MNGLKMKYFVLNPTKNDAYGHASRQAIRTYAKEIYTENPELSEDLFKWASDAETEPDMGGSEESAVEHGQAKQCDHDYSGGNYSTCSKCGEMVR